MCSSECGRHACLRVPDDSAVLLEHDILATLSEADNAQDGPRDSGALHPELEGGTFAAAASQVEFTLILILPLLAAR